MHWVTFVCILGVGRDWICPLWLERGDMSAVFVVHRKRGYVPCGEFINLCAYPFKLLADNHHWKYRELCMWYHII